MTESTPADDLSKNVIKDILDSGTEPEVLPDAPDHDDTEAYNTVLQLATPLAFYVDSRASITKLSETVSELIAVKHANRGIVSVENLPGVVIAREFLKAGIPFDLLKIGETLGDDVSHDPIDFDTAPSMDDAGYLRYMAAGVVELKPDQLGSIPALVVLVPAVVGTGEMYLDAHREQLNYDFSPSTLSGMALEQLHAANRDLIFIESVNNGLVTHTDGTEMRRLIHVAVDPANPQNTAPESADETTDAEG